MNSPEAYLQFKPGLITAEGDVTQEDTAKFLRNNMAGLTDMERAKHLRNHMPGKCVSSAALIQPPAAGPCKAASASIVSEAGVDPRSVWRYQIPGQ